MPNLNVKLLTLAALFALSCSGGAPETPQVAASAGECCGSFSQCSNNVCDTALHCGDTQTPTPVYVCCEIGKYCCTVDADCQAYLPGLACDEATSTCRTSCAADGDCAAAFHCEGTACLADLADAAACDEASDCASGNCSADFATADHLCVAAASCAHVGESIAVGYTLCDGSAVARRCDAAGTWGAEVANPQPAPSTCDAGGGPATGFLPAATCTSGFDPDAPGFATACQSCAPFKATNAGCITSCQNDDARCWAGHHCATAAGNVCASNENGSPCDNTQPTDCASGRCDPDPGNAAVTICQAKLANGAVCDEDGDCANGLCDSGVCRSRFADTVACTRDAQCQSGNCSADYDSGTSFCAPAGTCVDSGTGSYPVGYKLCAGTTSSRPCLSEGAWGGTTAFTPAACDARSGWLFAQCTSGTAPTNGLTTTCIHCPSGFAPNATFNGCVSNCASIDANCADAYWCNTATCSADLANASACARDAQCQTGRCDATCMDKLPDGSACDEASDCATGSCSGSICGIASGSCPFVFAWNGSEYEYQTDLQGNVIGPARFSARIPLYAPQYVVLPTLAPDLLGDVRVKLRETLPEVDYVDEVKLLVFDVAEGTDVISSSAEDTYRMGFAAPFQLSTARDPIPPVAATDQSGADILAQVRAVDDVIAPAEGVQEPVYTFDFGSVADPANAKLVIDGWAVIGPAFANATSLVSYLEVVDEGGAWVRARQLGFPSGDLKRMAISLGGLFRSSDHRVRLHVGRAPNSRWVVDRVLLDTSAPAPVTQVAELSADLADLRERGALSHRMASYESRIHAADDTQPVSPEHLAFGRFTQLGDVADLLGASDDRYVVMRNGDELEMVFPGGLPAPAPGTRRVYVAKVSLFYKTLDASNTVEPMPFHAMSDYPYPATESFPADWDHLLYLDTRNTRLYAP